MSQVVGDGDDRSIALQRFADVLVPGIDFISLQKEVDSTQAAILQKYGVAQLGQDFVDFADTAAAVALIDVVIAVDTSGASSRRDGQSCGSARAVLAGLALAARPHRQPVVPDHALFRQSAIGDWDGPLGRLRQELAAVTASRAAKQAVG